MSLSDLSAIGSLISSFAVLISLIYPGLQVRPQSAGVDPAGAWRTRAVDIILAAGDPALAEALPKGTAGAADISAAPGSRRSFLASAEDTYLQYREGPL